MKEPAISSNAALLKVNNQTHVPLTTAQKSIKNRRLEIRLVSL